MIRTPLSLLWHQSDSYLRVRVGLVALCALAGSVCAALAPLAFTLLLDALASREITSIVGVKRATIQGHNESDLSTEYVTIGGMLAPGGLLALYVVAQWFTRSLAEFRLLPHGQLLQRAQRRISDHAFAHLLTLPLRFHIHHPSGAATQVLSSALAGYRLILQHLALTLIPLIAELGTMIAVLARYCPGPLLVVFVASAFAYALVFAHSARALIAPARIGTREQAAANAILTDHLTNIAAVKACAVEMDARRRFGIALAESETAWSSFYLRRTTHGLVVALIFALSVGTSLSIALRELSVGVLTIGGFVLIHTYLLQIVRPIDLSGLAVRDIVQALALIEPLIKLLRETGEPLSLHSSAGAPRSTAPVPPHPDAPIVSRAPGALRAVIEFDHVSFAYKLGQPVLRNVNLLLTIGSVTAIVGASGCGKSTLLSLLLRLYEVDAGVIRFDGIPVTEMPLEQLRRNVALVPQDTVLLHDTVARNIAIARPDATRLEIEQAARIAHVHELIEGWPEGYETLVGERGLALSGGQRQRLAIARAVLRGARVLLLDEPTAALDSDAESQVLATLTHGASDVTVLMVTHRLSALEGADAVFELRDGALTPMSTVSRHQRRARTPDIVRTN